MYNSKTFQNVDFRIGLFRNISIIINLSGMRSNCENWEAFACLRIRYGSNSLTFAEIYLLCENLAIVAFYRDEPSVNYNIVKIL